MQVKRLLTNLCTKDLEQSKQFYTRLFAFNVDYDSDWFVHLITEGKELEIGLIAEGHDIVPAQANGKASGMYLTFVVDNVDDLFQKAQQLAIQILQPPEMTFYGQKRMLLVAPEGTICDVSSPA